MSASVKSSSFNIPVQRQQNGVGPKPDGLAAEPSFEAPGQLDGLSTPTDFVAEMLIFKLLHGLSQRVQGTRQGRVHHERQALDML